MCRGRRLHTGDDTTSAGSDGGVQDLAAPAGDLTTLVHGCPPPTNPLDHARRRRERRHLGQLRAGLLRDLLHALPLVDTLGQRRNGAPDGYNWDDETSVNAHIASHIRDAVGVDNFMPFNPPPEPTCAERGASCAGSTPAARRNRSAPSWHPRLGCL